MPTEATTDSVADLSRRLDRVLTEPIDDCPICKADHAMTLARAIRVLGGELTAEQEAGIHEAVLGAEAAWIPFDPKDFPPRAGAELRPRPRAAPRAARNAPCPCGSGKKYKKCHLEADERGGLH
jgi:hypothetical protein